MSLKKIKTYDIILKLLFFEISDSEDGLFDMICNTILEAMGNTPIIRLQRMVGPDDAEILVKFEGLNIGGSIKTRTAYNMILDAEK